MTENVMDERQRNPMPKMPKIQSRIWRQALIALLIVAAGLFLFGLLTNMRRPPARIERPVMAPLVEAITVHPENLEMTVEGFGTAQARRSVQIVPQVSGRVIACSPNFMDGGFFAAGEPLITIDPRDYELAVQNAQAAVARAEFQLQQEEAEAAVARREWEALKQNDEAPSPLVLREPQIKNARAQLQAAEAQLATARLNLERTIIAMPFNGRVVQKSVDVGQYVTPGQTLGSVYGTDAIEIVVPLEDFELEWFEAPLTYNGNRQGNRPGPEATVIADFAGDVHKWRGRIVRTQGRIDPTSRVINVIAEVDKPFEELNDAIPLTPGMFVRVQIKGRTLDNVICVPRYAVHSGDEVWVARDGRLNIQKAKIAREDDNYAYITAGLEDGDAIVISPLDAVTNGMLIRVQHRDTAPPEAEVREPTL